VSDNCSGATVAPAASCSVAVRFAPTTSGSQTDTLVIPSNDPDQAYVGFGVDGTGTSVSSAPNISISGNGAFGDVAIGSSGIRSITVSNAGNANLVINNMFGLAAPFSIVTDNCTGVSLPPTDSCGISVSFEPTVEGLKSDLLLISSNDPDESYASFSFNGTGTSIAAPNISVSGNGAFGSVNIGSNSTRTVTVSNIGTANLVIGSLNGLTAPFSIVSNDCNGTSLAPSGSCSVSVRFTPTVTGTKNDILIIPSNDPDQPSYNFAVSGTGTTPATPDISVSGNGAFGSVNIGSNSTRTVSVSNIGTANLVIGSLNGLAAPFSIVSNNCNGTSLAPAATCSVSVRFTPTVTGLKNDILIIPSNDPDQASYNFAVSGTGTTTPSPEVDIVNDGFEDGNANGWLLNGDVAIDETVKIGQYALRHVKGGASVLRISTVGYTGVSVKMYLAATDLDNGESCFAEVSTNGGNSWSSVVQVNNGNDNGTFYSGTVSPAGVDNNSNVQVRFRSNGGKKPDYCYGDDVIVKGTSSGAGLVPDITVSGNGAFGDVNTGSSSTRTVTVSNIGTANLLIGSLNGLTAPFSIVSNNCNGASLAPSGSCSVSVRFSPTLIGLKNDTLIIPSNDPDQASYNFAVSGTGTSTSAVPDISVSGNGAFGDVEVDTSSTRTVTISNIGTANLIISGVSGLAAPFAVVTNTCGTVVPAGTCAVNVRFSPTSAETFGDTLVINSNDPDQASVNFGLSGTGTQLPAQEEVILEEGFEDGNANGWLLNGSVSVDGILALGNYSLRHTKSSTSTYILSTIGYTDVSITMHVAATSLDIGEGCYAEISTNRGISWLTVVQVLGGNDDGSWKSGTISPAGANDIPDLQLRFRSTGEKKPDYCYGDDVIVSGTLN